MNSLQVIILCVILIFVSFLSYQIIAFNNYTNSVTCFDRPVALITATNNSLCYFNPSITIYEGKPMYSIRVCKPRHGTFLSSLTESGFRGGFHSTHKIIYDNTEIYELPSGDTYTYEDARIHAKEDGSVYAFVCTYYFGLQPSQISCVHFNPFTQTILNSTVLSSDEFASTTQKNWVTHYEDGKFIIIPFLNPLTIYEFDPNTNAMTHLKTCPKIDIPYDTFRGSSQLITVDNMLIGISHSKRTYLGYTHNAYIIDKETLTLKSYSNSFIFNRKHFKLDIPILIEFVSGLAKLNSTTARITFGVFNVKAMYVDIALTDLVAMASENQVQG